MYFNDQNTQFPLLQTEPRKLYLIYFLLGTIYFNPANQSQIIVKDFYYPKVSFEKHFDKTLQNFYYFSSQDQMLSSGLENLCHPAAQNPSRKQKIISWIPTLLEVNGFMKTNEMWK